VQIERLWTENQFTAEGNIIHEKAHSGIDDNSADRRTIRSAYIKSEKFGLFGQTDIIELIRTNELAANSIVLPGVNGNWFPFVVEYKRGAAISVEAYHVQVCAQVMCLEEMWNISIPESYIYFYQHRHRQNIQIGNELRNETINAIEQVHELFRLGATPKAVYGKKCIKCSLIDLCLPLQTGQNDQSESYISQLYTD
jgi:CRISPR-associated exonuclease Cas4